MDAQNTRRIVLLGKTGAGKSSLGNTIFREALFKVNHSPNSQTSICQAELKPVGGRNITLIDTPGLFDTDKSEEELMPETERCVIECAPGPHAFFIVLKVEKYTYQEKDIITKICQHFSEEALRYAIVLFTHGDQLPEGMKIREFVSQNKDLRGLVKKCGGRCHVIDNKYWNNNRQDHYRSNQFQVAELLNTVDKIVKDNKGGCYTNEVLQAVEREIQEEEARIKKSSGNLSREEVRIKAKIKISKQGIFRGARKVAKGLLMGALFGGALVLGLELPLLFLGITKGVKAIKERRAAEHPRQASEEHEASGAEGETGGAAKRSVKRGAAAAKETAEGAAGGASKQSAKGAGEAAEEATGAASEQSAEGGAAAVAKEAAKEAAKRAAVAVAKVAAGAVAKEVARAAIAGEAEAPAETGTAGGVPGVEGAEAAEGGTSTAEAVEGAAQGEADGAPEAVDGEVEGVAPAGDGEAEEEAAADGETQGVAAAVDGATEGVAAAAAGAAEGAAAVEGVTGVDGEAEAVDGATEGVAAAAEGEGVTAVDGVAEAIDGAAAVVDGATEGAQGIAAAVEGAAEGEQGIAAAVEAAAEGAVAAVEEAASAEDATSAVAAAAEGVAAGVAEVAAAAVEGLLEAATENCCVQ